MIRSREVFSWCWILGNILPLTLTAYTSLTSSYAIWGKVCATIIFILIIATARYFIINRNSVIPSALMKGSFRYIFIAYLVSGTSLAVGWISLVNILYPFLLLLFFVENDKIITWLDKEK